MDSATEGQPPGSASQHFAIADDDESDATATEAARDEENEDEDVERRQMLDAAADFTELVRGNDVETLRQGVQRLFMYFILFLLIN